MIDVTADNGVRCIVVDDWATFDRMLTFLLSTQAQGKVVGFDTETTSKFVPRADLVGMSFAVSRREGFYVPVGHDFGDQLPLAEVVERIAPVLDGPGISCSGGKFDIRVMRKYGVELRLSHDTLSITRLLGDVEYGVGLKPTVKRFYGEDVTEFTDVVPKAKKGKPQMTFAQVEITEAARYAVPDAVNAWRLTVDALPLLPEDVRGLLLEVEIDVMRRAALMEDHGLPIDRDFVERQIEAGREIEKQLYVEAVSELERLAAARGKTLPTPKGGINLNSAPQLQEILFNVCGLPVMGRSKKTGNPSADAKVLEKLAQKYGPVNKIARYRSAGTTIGRLEEFLTFGMPRDEWWFAHGSLNPTGAATGRWSGSDPNTQNIPKGKTTYSTAAGEWAFRVRDSVCAQPGFGLVSADYSQIELRVAAALSGCRSWLDAYAEDADVHTVTAAAALGIPFDSVSPEQRQMGKTLNFSMLFGAGASNVAQQLGISEDLAQQLIDGFWSGLPEVTSWVAQTEAFCKREGYTKTYFGRRRYLPEVHHETRWIAQKALREAVNHPIQGTAADILKIALVRQWAEQEAMGARSFMVVHDQIVWAVPLETSPAEFCERVRAQVEFPIQGFPRIAIDFGIGQRLGSLVEYKGSKVIPDRWEDVAEEERAAAERWLEVSVDRALSQDELTALRELLLAFPGETKVLLRCGQGEFELKAQTSLTVHDRLRWQAAVAGASVAEAEAYVSA